MFIMRCFPIESDLKSRKSERKIRTAFREIGPQLLKFEEVCAKSSRQHFYLLISPVSFDSIHGGKMEPILLTDGLLKENVTF